MKKPAAVPAFISSLRIATLPLFIYLCNMGNAAACLGLLAFCATTDFFDGYAARKLNAASRFGGYYDATTDFALMFGSFTFFYFDGFYPLWLPLLIAVAFIQFLITSFLAKKLYTQWDATLEAHST
jgi:phosphatidylglycerophosphate synthase